jgi:hypothetical protein
VGREREQAMGQLRLQGSEAGDARAILVLCRRQSFEACLELLGSGVSGRISGKEVMGCADDKDI